MGLGSREQICSVINSAIYVALISGFTSSIKTFTYETKCFLYPSWNGAKCPPVCGTDFHHCIVTTFLNIKFLLFKVMRFLYQPGKTIWKLLTSPFEMHILNSNYFLKNLGRDFLNIRMNHWSSWLGYKVSEAVNWSVSSTTFSDRSASRCWLLKSVIANLLAV